MDTQTDFQLPECSCQDTNISTMACDVAVNKERLAKREDAELFNFFLNSFQIPSEA